MELKKKQVHNPEEKQAEIHLSPPQKSIDSRFRDVNKKLFAPASNTKLTDHCFTDLYTPCCIIQLFL